MTPVGRAFFGPSLAAGGPRDSKPAKAGFTRLASLPLLGKGSAFGGTVVDSGTGADGKERTGLAASGVVSLRFGVGGSSRGESVSACLDPLGCSSSTAAESVGSL